MNDRTAADRPAPGRALRRLSRRALCRALLLALPALTLACADAIEPDEGVCDEARPCAFGAVCVAGYCQPPPPRFDAARLDGGRPDRDPDPEPEPDAAAPRDARVDLDRAPPADAARDATAGDLAPPSDADPIEPDVAVDLGPADAALPDDCGHHGEVCCPDDRCRSGACLDGVCAAFGGAYAFGGLDDGCTARNPLSRNQCTCPAGFAAHPLEDVDLLDREALGGVSHSVYVCLPPRVDATADLRGAFAEATDPDGLGCPRGCRPGPLGPGCGCPDGTVAQTHPGVRHIAPLEAACPRTLTLCAGPEPVTFGGSYRTRRQIAPCADLAPVETCLPNPTTGACGCPAGFVPQTIPMMAPHPRRAVWCEADLSLCVPAP